MPEKENLLAELDAARAELQALVDRVSRNQRIYDPWTMKEVLDHIAGWDDAIFESVQAYLKGDVPGTPAKLGINQYNEETVATREALPFEHSIKEWQASREKLKTLIAGVTDEQFEAIFVVPWGEKATIRELLHTFIEHERQHAREISAIISGQ